METNDLQAQTNESYQLEFKGEGTAFFGILLANWILTILTLGFYYPWARAKQLQYIYSHTTLNKESFSFSGTGAEIFKGFIKLVGIYLLVMFAFFMFISYAEAPILGAVLLYLVIFAFIPFIIHGSFRYRMSRTSYRGIRFGYRGDRKELTVQFFRDLLFTVLTFGIYSSWLSMNLRAYTHRHIRYGDVEFSNEASGSAYFLLNLKGTLLTIITLGIYSFWWQKDIFNYYIDNMKLQKGDEKIAFQSTATGVDFFKLLVTNFLILVFTFGIGAAWIEMRTFRFIFSHIRMTGNINLNAVTQTEAEYNDAFGEDAVDFFNIDLV
jgi:uncharacterized membrane protein YjgN (DUF898 family)